MSGFGFISKKSKEDSEQCKIEIKINDNVIETEKIMFVIKEEKQSDSITYGVVGDFTIEEIMAYIKTFNAGSIEVLEKIAKLDPSTIPFIMLELTK